MVRVLQLIPHGCDFQTRRSIDILWRELGGEFQVESRSIGHGGTYRSAISAVMALRPAGEFDLLHAWGALSLTAAAIGFAAPIVYSPAGPFRMRQARWLRAVMGYRNVHVICPTATCQRLLIERGIEPGRCHVIRPGVEFA